MYVLKTILITTLFFNIAFSQKVLVSDSDFSAEVIRDGWGVPHIYGIRDADVSFGLAYAHCQDDFETIQDVVLL